jgi:shikimate dehydrogenase
MDRVALLPCSAYFIISNAMMAVWPSGKAGVCKILIPSSNLGTAFYISLNGPGSRDLVDTGVMTKALQLCLTGYPLGHSLSPIIHTWLLQAAGWDGRYDCRPCPPEALADQVQQFKAQGLRGWNVTIPHKGAMIELVDQLTPLASCLQAVNTVRREPDGSLTGHNTDGLGFWNDLPAEVQTGLAGQPVVVLGAGGSARAVLAALAEHGQVSAITLVVRSPDKAQAVADWLVGQFPVISVAVVAFADEVALTQALSKAVLLVNTTPIGMSPKVDASPLSPTELEPLSTGTLVYDLIYNPQETALLRQAGAMGLPVQNGLGMLIGQAVAAFAFWTGYELPPDQVPALRAHVLAAMAV